MIKFFLFLVFSTVLNAQDSEFDILMGKHTSHWEHATPNDQQVLLELKKNYEEKIPLCATPTGKVKIPHTVHFIWLGPKPFPPQSVENIRTWMAKHPDWTFKFWTDRDRTPPCNGMQKLFVKDFAFQVLGNRFADSQNYGEQSDILRYEILFQEGGVYVDHDANCLQSFDNLHDAYDFYCGLEAPHPVMAGHRITCGNGVIGSRPGHPVVHQILELIDEHWDPLAARFCGNDKFSKEELVLRRTYIALTHALEGNLNQFGNTDIVLPAAHFFAKSGIDPIYSKHFYANAWAENEKKLAWEKEMEKELNTVKKRAKQTNLWLYMSAILAGAACVFASFSWAKRRKI